MVKRKISRRAVIQKKRRRLRILFLILFVLLTINLIIYSISIFFKVQKIYINGLEKYSLEEILENIALNYGDRLLFIDKNEVKIEILSKYPYIDTIEVKRIYPNEIEINVTESENFATIYLDEKHYAVNDKFKVLSEISYLEAVKLPKIIGFEPEMIEIGKEISSLNSYKYECLVEVINYFEKYGYLDLVTEFNLTKSYDVIIKCGIKYQIEIGKIENLDHKMKMFGEVLKKLTPSDTVVIDVSDNVYTRFRSEIIRPSVYP